MKSLARRWVPAVAFLCLCLSAAAAAAQQAARVEGVQMPAWVEHDGKRSPLAPGMELKAGDKLITGSGSRALVKLSEGSLVKLGENGTLQFKQLEPTRELFKAALGVLEGAFRFTTQAIGANRRREVSITVATVTAGIRGTDLWGRSRMDRQIVCLLEGKIEIGAPDEKPVTMDQPLQFYQREKGHTKPVGFVEKKQIDEWAKETEIEAGKGAARRGGKWKLQLTAADNQNAALALYEQVRAAGYAAEIFAAKEGDKRVYVVRIRNLPSKAEAEALAAQLRGKYGIAEPKISS